MKQPTNKRTGFTLVEVIVTLVVLGILAGVGVPAMTGWIDNARTMTCQANRTSLLETYAAYRAMKRIPATDADSRFADFLQEESSLGQERGCPTGGQYALVANAAVTCTKHSLKKGGMDASTALATALEAFKKTPNSSTNSFDSGAPAQYSAGASKDKDTNVTRLLSMVDGLKETLSDSGVMAWNIGYSTRNNGGYVYTWTDQDIQNLPVGSWVRAYRYNGAYNAYTVGYVKIVQNDEKNWETMGTYPIISYTNWVEANKDKDMNPMVQNDETKKTYDGVVDMYNTLMETSATKPAGK